MRKDPARKSIRDWILGYPDALIGSIQYEDHEGTAECGIPTSGTLLWDQVVRENSAYDIPGKEISLIADTISAEIKSLSVMPAMLVDLGCGGATPVGQKVVPIAYAIQTDRVLLVDRNQDSLDEATNLLVQRFPEREILGLCDDFMHSTIRLSEPHFVTLFGVTIGNLSIDIQNTIPPKREVVHFIRRLLQWACGGYVLFTFDECLDEKENIIKYCSGSMYYFHLNMFDRAVFDNKMSRLDREGIHYYPQTKTWFDGDVAVASIIIHRARFAKGSLMYDGEVLNVPEGVCRVMNHSLKFSEAFMEECVEAAGARLVACWKNRPVVAMLICQL